MLRGSWLGSATGTRFRFDRYRVPSLTRAAVQTPANLAPEFVKLHLPKAILFVDKAKTLAHNLAGRGVQARTHLCAHELLKLRS
jgi:hypothetical protein